MFLIIIIMKSWMNFFWCDKKCEKSEIERYTVFVMSLWKSKYPKYFFRASFLWCHLSSFSYCHISNKFWFASWLYSIEFILHTIFFYHLIYTENWTLTNIILLCNQNRMKKSYNIIIFSHNFCILMLGNSRIKSSSKQYFYSF